MSEWRIDELSKDNLFKIAILNAYEDIVHSTMKEIFCAEHIVLEQSDSVTIEDYNNELRHILSTMLTQYYSVNSLDSLLTFSAELNHQIDGLVNKGITESVPKLLAVRHVLHEVDRQIKYLKEF